MKKIVIIGAGISGLECAKNLKKLGCQDFVIIEKHKEIIRTNSWKTFKKTLKEFDLEDCYFNELKKIQFRTCDIDSLSIITNTTHNIPCYVLDSKAVYKKYLKDLNEFVLTNTEVESISRKNGGYEICTTNPNHKTIFADIIIDGSGTHSVVEEKLFNNEFNQNAYYTCYSKRYRKCNTKPILDSAFFDFDQPFRLCGSWVYPIDEETVEIGVARFSNSKEFSDPVIMEELESLLAKYKKLEPYNEVFDGNEEFVEISKGYCALVPRIDIMKENVYFIGDAKGAVPYSGYGIANALESAKACAESIMNKTKYRYYVCPPEKGLAILRILWSLGPEFRLAASGIAGLEEKEVRKFYTGGIDFSFFVHCAKISAKQGINTLVKIPLSLTLRAILGLKPKKKHLKFAHVKN